MTEENGQGGEQPPVIPAPGTGTEPGQQAGDKPPEGKFTQADMDRVVADRLKRHEESILKKIGVGNLDEAKQAATRLKEIEDAQKSAEQKLQERLDAATQAQQKAESDRREALYRAAVIAEASKPGMVAGDRLDAAYRLTDLSKLTINDQGEVVGAADAVKGLLEKNPFLKAEPTKPPPTPPLDPSNPAGMGEVESDLSWLPYKKGADRTFGKGGVIPPSGG